MVAARLERLAFGAVVRGRRQGVGDGSSGAIAAARAVKMATLASA